MAIRKARSVLDFIEARAEAERKGTITLEEFTTSMRSGDRDKMDEAVQRMYDAGGYENLE